MEFIILLIWDMRKKTKIKGGRKYNKKNLWNTQDPFNIEKNAFKKLYIGILILYNYIPLNWILTLNCLIEVLSLKKL